MNATDDRPAEYSSPIAPAAPEPTATGQPYAPQAPRQDSRTKSPALAGFLSCMPGLGQVYVGYYVRGFVHAITVGTLITLLATGELDDLIPLAAVFLSFFWLHNVIDAVRRASLFNLYLSGDHEIELPDDFSMPKFGGSIFGGLILIVAGFILLLNTRWNVSLAWLDEWWPLAPILLGLYLFGKAVQERLAGAED